MTLLKTMNFYLTRKNPSGLSDKINIMSDISAECVVLINTTVSVTVDCSYCLKILAL